MTSVILIREAGPADAETLFEVHKDAVRSFCATAYSEEQLSTWFEGRSPEIYGPAIEAHQILVAERQSRILGFVGFEPGEITLLFVRKEAAGQGLGKRLFAIGMERAEAGFTGPITVVATRNAQRFYQNQGFSPVERDTFVRGKAEVHFEVIKMQRPGTKRAEPC